MMMPAKLHEVVETGLTAVGPVLDVVSVKVGALRAAPEAAAFVTHIQGTP
jgi:hypothetical protein